MRGRKPKPKPDPETKEFPGKSSALPRAPAHFDKPTKEKFNEIAAELSKLGILGAGDVHLVTMLAWSLATWQKANELCGEDYVLMSEKGGTYQNPYHSVANKALEQVHKLCAELGLTPTSRARLIIGGNTNKDSFSGDVRKR